MNAERIAVKIEQEADGTFTVWQEWPSGRREYIQGFRSKGAARAQIADLQRVNHSLNAQKIDGTTVIFDIAAAAFRP